MNDMIDNGTLQCPYYWPFLLKYDLLYTPFTFLKNTYYNPLSQSLFTPQKSPFVVIISDHVQ